MPAMPIRPFPIRSNFAHFADRNRAFERQFEEFLTEKKIGATRFAGQNCATSTLNPRDMWQPAPSLPRSNLIKKALWATKDRSVLIVVSSVRDLIDPLFEFEVAVRQ